MNFKEGDAVNVVVKIERGGHCAYIRKGIILKLYRDKIRVKLASGEIKIVAPSRVLSL